MKPFVPVLSTFRTLGLKFLELSVRFYAKVFLTFRILVMHQLPYSISGQWIMKLKIKAQINGTVTFFPTVNHCSKLIAYVWSKGICANILVDFDPISPQFTVDWLLP